MGQGRTRGIAYRGSGNRSGFSINESLERPAQTHEHPGQLRLPIEKMEKHPFGGLCKKGTCGFVHDLEWHDHFYHGGQEPGREYDTPRS